VRGFFAKNNCLLTPTLSSSEEEREKTKAVSSYA
jgi:hypothetical protein